MSRSGFWRRARRSEWSRTARTDHWRRVSTAGGAPAVLRPDTESDLADGVQIQTQLLGRVLGVRLLRVDGIVMVTPARLVSDSGQRPPRTGQRTRADAADPPHADPPHAGSGLAQAASLLSQSSAILRRQR